MNKNILLLTGSPRTHGNSDLMADAFAKGAESAGNKVTRIDTSKLHINPCKACDTCYSKGTACSFDDDFNRIAQIIEEADVIAFAMPLYWCSFPAQMKLVIDKIYAFIIGQRNIENKESVLLVCGGDTEDVIYQGLLCSYDEIIRFLKWKDAGKVVVKGIYDKGQVVETEGITQAEELGRKIS